MEEYRQQRPPLAVIADEYKRRPRPDAPPPTTACGTASPAVHRSHHAAVATKSERTTLPPRVTPASISRGGDASQQSVASQRDGRSPLRGRAGSASPVPAPAQLKPSFISRAVLKQAERATAHVLATAGAASASIGRAAL